MTNLHNITSDKVVTRSRSRSGSESADDDDAAWDWRRSLEENKAPISGAMPPSSNRAEEDPFDHEWGWSPQRPQPVKNPDVSDPSAPWSSGGGDEELTAMVIREDFNDEDSIESEKEPPSNIAIPVWSCFNILVLTAIACATFFATSRTTPPRGRSPASAAATTSSTSSPHVQTNLPPLVKPPILPCLQDAGCEFILRSIDPVLPSSTKHLLGVPGTCQNWSLEWLRTGKDILEFQVGRIRQRFAMAMMYCEFDGTNWHENDLWVSDLHECDWSTVDGADPCSKEGKYQIIRNFGQQLRGTLPPELSMISSLWEIMLSDNLLEGQIPEEYARLTLLDTLILSYNLFRGPIPDFVWKFEDMMHMDLGYNFFNSEIPNTVYLDEPNLSVLFLENNDMVGTIPPELAASENLRRLHLDGNLFEGPIPEELFQGKRQLEALFLHGNNFEGPIPTGVGNLDMLQELTLYHNNLTGDIEEVCKNSISNGGKLESAQVDKYLVACSCCLDGGTGDV